MVNDELDERKKREMERTYTNVGGKRRRDLSMDGLQGVCRSSSRIEQDNAPHRSYTHIS